MQALLDPEAISILGTGAGGNGALVTGTGSGTVTGAVTLTGDTSMGGAGALTVNGGIAGAGFAVTKVGAGTLNLAGTQTYASLTTNGGITNVNTAIGTGTSTVTANAATNFYASQTLASLTIGTGAEVTFGDGLAFAGGPEKFGAPALVPEPGSLGLLLTGSLGLLGRRRRRAWSGLRKCVGTV